MSLLTADGARRSWPPRWLAKSGSLLFGCALLLGCGASEDDDPADEPDTGGTDGGAHAVASQVSFFRSSVVMAPGEARPLSVSIEPAGVHRVRFALLGDSLDASLDRAEIDTDADGNGTVSLTAPSRATAAAFRVRASVGNDTAAELTVTISANASGTLSVSPSYSGARPVQFWVVGAHPSTTCAELTGVPPAEGDLKAQAASGYEPVLEVPAGRALAVTLRGEEKVFGCREVTPLTAHELRVLTISVADVPLRLNASPLALELGFASIEPSGSSLLSPAIARLTDRLIGDSDGDLDALLDAMVAIAEERQLDVDLAAARAGGGWDGALGSHAGSRGGERLLRDAIEGWIATELEREEPLAGTVTPVSGVPGKAELAWTSLAGVPAAEAGLPAQSLVSWRAEPGDRLLLGASVELEPAPLLAALAIRSALAEQPAASTLPGALAEQLDCITLGVDLYTRTESMMGRCDADCTAGLCALALDALWQRAITEEPTAAPALLELGATATATVDAQARPLSCTGTWVGTLALEDVTAEASGPLTGELSASPSD